MLSCLQHENAAREHAIKTGSNGLAAAALREKIQQIKALVNNTAC
jgi:hypothetical protein